MSRLNSLFACMEWHPEPSAPAAPAVVDPLEQLTNDPEGLRWLSERERQDLRRKMAGPVISERHMRRRKKELQARIDAAQMRAMLAQMHASNDPPRCGVGAIDCEWCQSKAWPSGSWPLIAGGKR